MLELLRILQKQLIFKTNKYMKNFEITDKKTGQLQQV